MMTKEKKLLHNNELFARRHIGPREDEVSAMLAALDVSSLEELMNKTLPSSIRVKQPLQLGPSRSEQEVLDELRTMAVKNKLFRSFIGMGYSDCITPTVILRNVLENPGWYTQYTPYQAEIAQGRLEALLNFQTMIIDLTGLPVANASMLDEATAAAEAMSLCYAVKNQSSMKVSQKQEAPFLFFVSALCHPQTIEVVRTRAEPLGIQVVVGSHIDFNFRDPALVNLLGALVQSPATDGKIYDYKNFINQIHEQGGLAVVASDILGLTWLATPAEMGADIAIGSAQRFGVPMGYGGPHAAYFATKEEYKRLIPGRVVGVSKDVHGKAAIRLALQTREQHIRRDKATSNICTAQVLLAVMASMYAVYHGPQGLTRIAQNVFRLACVLKIGLEKLKFEVGELPFFDTIRVTAHADLIRQVLKIAQDRQINLRALDSLNLTISLDEVTQLNALDSLFEIFALASGKKLTFSAHEIESDRLPELDSFVLRKSSFLQHPVFNSYHSETEMLRYLFRLQSRDLSLTHSMIPLGSCTMKLNATSEMIPVTWPEFGKIHPFTPLDQVPGYQQMLRQLEKMLCEITGFSGVSLQPNAGSQGEYTGLLVIRKYLQSQAKKEGSLRNICLIPKSAHGTNPASAAMAGMKIVVVECDAHGNVDLGDLKAKVTEHSGRLAALMVTYPSTHGVFEESIGEICSLIHAHGGQVYMDGANMNAQIGLCRPGDFGPDVCHLNLHKTFCIPHGGGGPGMGPIAVASHLVEFLPRHPVVTLGGSFGMGPVSAAPWGSASILPISWMYISMMGGEGLTLATQIAILNANYLAHRLSPFYPVLYRGKNGLVAHECIFDCRPFKETAGIEVEDVAKRLMDYGFHAPTVSFPVAGTLMVEPTESESKVELDRFCEAMICIREEIREIEKGVADRSQNVLKNAPHTAGLVTQSEWPFPYSREKAAFPVPGLRDHKFWPYVGRINNVLGDRNLICACPPIESYS